MIHHLRISSGISSRITGNCYFQYSSYLDCCSIGDFFPRHLKLMIYILYTVGVLSFAWFAILCAKFIPFNTGKFSS